MFGWHGGLTAAQTAEIAVAKQVIYDGFKTAITEGVPKNKAGILVDEQFGAAILRDAKTDGFTNRLSGREERSSTTRTDGVARSIHSRLTNAVSEVHKNDA
jgi:hypothetical protein